MIYLRQVVGKSMLPTLRSGQLCIFVRTRRLRAGEVVLAVVDGRPLVKRLFLAEEGFELKGDNLRASDTYALSTAAARASVQGRLIWPRTRRVAY